MSFSAKYNKVPTAIWLLILFIVALSVRLLHINSTDIAGDEPFSIFMAQLDVLSIVKHLSKDNSPPLFELVLHYYTRFVGRTDFLLRLLPVVFSALIPIPVFLIGKKFFTDLVGWVAAGLVTFSIYHIRFSHEVRVYAFFSLLTALALYLFLLAVSKPDKKVYSLGLVVVNLLLLYSHYTSVYVVFVQIMCVVLFVPLKKWRSFFISYSMVGIGYLPYLFVLTQRLGEVSSSGTWVPTPGWGEVYGNINLLLNSKWVTLVVLLLLGAAIILSRNAFRQTVAEILKNRAGLVILLWFIIPYLMMFGVSMSFLPMFMDRYVLYTSIPLFLLVAWIINHFFQPLQKQEAAAAVLCISSLLTTNLNPPNNREIRDATEHLARLNTEDAKVYICPRMFNLAIAYHLEDGSFLLADNEIPTRRLDSALAANQYHFVSDVSQIDLSVNKVVYLDAASNFVHPENGILDHLSTLMHLEQQHHHHEIFDIYVFRRKETVVL